jgi:RNA polymerase sigma factor (sigma-70 family)
MPSTDIDEVGLVHAARSGDGRARDELVRQYLPLIYSIVRRALDGTPDVDDVVQETMLRAVRDLPALRSAASFRPWITAIAVRQVGTSRRRRQSAAERFTRLDGLTGVADADADIENVTALRMDLSEQRRQVQRAARWLDPDDRTALSLWWLEVAGELTRAELAEALGVSPPAAGVRVQRMRQQLELCRTLVSALEATPRCPDLGAVLAGWTGRADSVWRKRIARHLRSCERCEGPGTAVVGTERLLAGAGLLAVPLPLHAALVGESSLLLAGAATFTAPAGLLSRLTGGAGTHVVAAAAAAGLLAAGIVAAIAVATGGDAPTVVVGAPAPEDGAAAGTPAAEVPTLKTGPVSLESVVQAGRFITVDGVFSALSAVGAASDATDRARATFDAGAGLTDADCWSFRTVDGGYLRHASWRLRSASEPANPLFPGDATFCARPGADPGTVLLESANYPGWYVHPHGTELWVDQADGGPAFRAESTFRLRAPLAS